MSTPLIKIRRVRSNISSWLGKNLTNSKSPDTSHVSCGLRDKGDKPMVHRMPIPTRLLGFLFAVVASLPALAQSDRGAISGTVIDQNGAAVRRAKVTVVNLDSGASREVTTTDDGTFVVPELRAAPYRLTVEAAGFKTMTLDGLQIAVQVTRRVDVRLEVGALGEVTTVIATAGALQTEGPVLQTNGTEQQVRELPLQIGAESGGRSPLSFIFLDSGVSTGGDRPDQM